MEKEILDSIDTIDAIDTLANRIYALLDLIQSNDNADEESIKVSAEMSTAILDEMMIEVEKLEKIKVPDLNKI